MKLIIKNFGAIKDASIDLSKRFYLFFGFNNTGKTYLVKLLYDIFDTDLLQEFVKSKYNKQQFTLENIILDKKTIDNLLDDYSNFLKNTIIPKNFNNNLESDLDNSGFNIEFNFDFNEIQKQELKSGATIVLKEHQESSQTSIQIYQLIKEADSLEVKIDYSSDEEIYNQLPADFFKNIAENRFKERVNSMKNEVSETLVKSLLNLLLQTKEKPFFLPANRIFLLENADLLEKQEASRKKELSEILVDYIENKDSKKETQDILSKILAKKTGSDYPPYLRYLIDEILKLRSSKDVDFIENGNRFYPDLITMMTKIMGGEIVIEKINDISKNTERFSLIDVEKKTHKTISFNMASSSVNQLSTLYLYLKYWAKPKHNFLMIDEPEENLHPESQIELIDLLLEFLNNENRLLITTHSPLVSEIINNYAILTQLSNKEDIAAVNNMVSINIAIDQIGIFFFDGQRVSEEIVGQYGTTYTSFKKAQDKVFKLGDLLAELMYNSKI